MAVNESRSMNAELREGISDGAVHKIAPDRGGVVEYNGHVAYDGSNTHVTTGGGAQTAGGYTVSSRITSL